MDGEGITAIVFKRFKETDDANQNSRVENLLNKLGLIDRLLDEKHLQTIDRLEEVDFNNLTEVGQTSSLRYIGVSACPKLVNIAMNCDDPNYEIRWADESILDLQKN